MKVEFISHSGVTVETEDNYLIFDYYRGKLPIKEKDTSVFITHFHQDHFNPEIYKMTENSPNVDYIISKDVEKKKKHKKAHVMGPNESIRVNDLKISAFDSTDEGLSFLVEVDGKNVFHSGDLNLWIWEEDTEAEREEMTKKFNKIISEIKGNMVDLAFFLVDSRLEDMALEGIKIFINEIQPKFLIPIHYWDDFNSMEKLVNKLEEEMPKMNTKILKPKKVNEIIEI
ncbi:MAG: MBL fold metallo-hydrolase [Tissierellia bacterium]|nr:MBL fold metallo-hydrolase [Tissierellia bacterium]